MAGEQSRKSLEFRITNNAQIKLEYRRTEDDRSCSHLRPELLCGSSDSFHAFSTSNALGLGWLLIYESTSFTLATFFFLRSRPEGLSRALHLELSMDKVHLGDFRETFDRLTLQQDPPNPAATAVARAEFSGDGYVRLGAGSFAVMATASHRAGPLLRVEVEERHFPWDFPPAPSEPPPAPPESCRYCRNAAGTSGGLEGQLERQRH